MSTPPDPPSPIRTHIARRAVSEFIGTALLVAIVVGSGVAAQTLSPHDTGLALLENSITTALGLGVLILALGPVSGAHFNPVVSIAEAIETSRRPDRFTARDVLVYALAQILGAIAGAALADAMFGVPVAISTTTRATGPHLLAEVVATAGLVLLIFALGRSGRGALAAPAVGAYIGAAYWFTSSTSFANPAVTLGRIFTDTFAGIAPASVLPFIGAQLVGGAVGLLAVRFLYPRPASSVSRDSEFRVTAFTS